MHLCSNLVNFDTKIPKHFLTVLTFDGTDKTWESKMEAAILLAVLQVVVQLDQNSSIAYFARIFCNKHVLLYILQCFHTICPSQEKIH